MNNLLIIIKIILSTLNHKVTRKKLLIKLFVPFVLLIFLSVAIIGLSSKSPSPTLQSNWILQTNLQTLLKSRVVMDMTFIDSVTGFAITNALTQTDTCFIFKTTNGGENWFVNYWTNEEFANLFNKIKFVDVNTGYICGGGGIALICKTTDRGNTWLKSNYYSTTSFTGMSCLNKDTIYVVNNETLTGGVFRSTNGGTNWEHLTSGEPDNIYMCNSRIGFYNDGYLKKTTDGGYNWVQIDHYGFYKMIFFDSLLGFRIASNNDSTSSNSLMQKTTNGGFNWITQKMPQITGNYIYDHLQNFYFSTKDTIWAIGGYIEYLNPVRHRGIIFKTTNGGLNWGYQLPDTHLIQIQQYNLISLYNQRFCWLYNGFYSFCRGCGVHTTLGGDTTYYTSIKEQVNNISSDFILYQNYPNPFNSISKIKYQIMKAKNYDVTLKIFDITGKNISILVNKKQSSGTYEVNFDARNLSSGIYFYSLFIENEKIDTKKFILIK